MVACGNAGNDPIGPDAVVCDIAGNDGSSPDTVAGGIAGDDASGLGAIDAGSGMDTWTVQANRQARATMQAAINVRRGVPLIVSVSPEPRNGVERHPCQSPFILHEPRHDARPDASMFFRALTPLGRLRLWSVPDDGEQSPLGGQGLVEVGGALDGAVRMFDGDDLGVVLAAEVALAE